MAAILEFDMTRLPDTYGNDWIESAVAENPKFGVGIAKHVHIIHK